MNRVVCTRKRGRQDNWEQKVKRRGRMQLKPMLQCSINKCQCSLWGLSSWESLSEVTAADNGRLFLSVPIYKSYCCFFKRLAPKTEATGEPENLPVLCLLTERIKLWYVQKINTQSHDILRCAKTIAHLNKTWYLWLYGELPSFVLQWLINGWWHAHHSALHP